MDANTLPATVSLLELSTDSDWIGLHEQIDPTLGNAAVERLLAQLRAAGARSALVENAYLDADYSAEFSGFYSRLFRQFRRHCRRLDFFSFSLSDAAASGVTGLVSAMEEGCDAGKYLGFLVVRPVQDAPIGKAVTNALVAQTEFRLRPQVSARYDAHPIGAKLFVRGMPFTQQDQRISACAQASIWMSGRHFHTRHRGPWCSTVSITEAASQPTDMTLASALPAGSSGLNVNNILRALRSMDRFPYAFVANVVDAPGGVKALSWPAPLDPQAILSRYVASGIPVILGLWPWAGGQQDGHAVVVVGDTFQPLDPPILSKSRPNAGELSPYFLVHDDQLGPNLLMPAQPGLPHGQTPYNVRDHILYIVVPLPDKVFLPAETAERTAWDYLQWRLAEWSPLKAKYGTKIGGSVDLGDAVVAANGSNQIIARTYVTFGWKYKQRLLKSGAAPALRELVAVQDLPKMVWVTEFTNLTDINKLDASKRGIFGHCVIDATATGPAQSPLIFHSPGFLTTYRQRPIEFFGESEMQLTLISDDRTYVARSRYEV